MVSFGFLIYSFSLMGASGYEDGIDMSEKSFGVWLFFFAVLAFA